MDSINIYHNKFRCSKCKFHNYGELHFNLTINPIIVKCFNCGTYFAVTSIASFKGDSDMELHKDDLADVLSRLNRLEMREITNKAFNKSSAQKFQEKVSRRINSIPMDMSAINPVDSFEKSLDVQNEFFIYQNCNYMTKLILNALALNGEAGEVADRIKKQVWYKPILVSDFKKDMAMELQHVVYHVAELATLLGFTLDEILESLPERKEGT